MPKDGLLIRDAKGYWAVLGLSPGSDTAAVKAAYRRRAKELHPDHNPSPRAREDFHLLSEAYRELSDPTRRKAYDEGPSRTRRRRTSGAPPDAADAARAYAQASTDRVVEAPVACRACGRIPAQPRYVVLPTVQGRLWKSVRGTVEGVYCRRCADGAALAAAVQTWVFGWWSLPFGPIHTVSALLTILRGGAFPRDKNFRLLLRQSRAFLARQDRELARGVALQARAYATDDDQRRLADAVLRAAQDVRPARSLKNRWLGGSWLRSAQLAPPAMMAVVILAGLGTWTEVNLWGTPVTPSAPPSLSTPPLSVPSLTSPPPIAGLQRPLLLRTGQLYEITIPRLPVHKAPGEDADVIAILDGGALLLVTENAPKTGWVRVLTPTGDSGFVAGRFLTPGLAFPDGSSSGRDVPGVIGRGVTDGGPGADAARDMLGGGVTDGNQGQ